MARMVLVAVTVLVGLGAGYAFGGRLANFNRVRLHHAWLLAVAIAAQGGITVLALLDGPVHSVAYPLLLASHLVLFAFVWANRRLPGMALIFAGFALNAAVIAANGAMPVSPDAVEQVAGEPIERREDFQPGKHRLLDEDDRLPFLADVIPVPALRTVISVGDIVLAAGVCVLVVSLMRARGSRRRSRRRGADVSGPSADPARAPHRSD